MPLCAGPAHGCCIFPLRGSAGGPRTPGMITARFTLRTTALLRHASLAVLLLSAASGANAVEEDDEDFNSIARKEKDPHHVNDLRLGYSMLPAGADVSILDDDGANPANYDRSTNWDKTGRLGLMWMTPWSGVSEDGDFILGLELSTNHCVIESSTTSPEIDLRSYQLTLHPGLAWLLDDNFHVELNPYLGIGHAQFEQDIAGDGSALYWEVGFRAAGYYTWRNGVQLGLQLGYMYGYTEGDIEGGVSTYETEMSINGLTVGLQLGYRL
jgi:hypothetical protein